MELGSIGDRIDQVEALDQVVAPVQQLVDRVLPPGAAKDALHGVWLGHPLHPSMTDVPIGFWTSAFVLDLVGGRRAQRAADTLVGLGVLSALPTAAAGAADWSAMNDSDKRAGIVHALANITATSLYALSFVSRKRGRRGRGVVLGMLGATAATAGGYLGGHLSFRRAIGPNRATGAPGARDWTSVEVDGELSDEKPALAHLDGAELVAARTSSGPTALLDRCSHLGGPLHEGELVDETGRACVRCPWHGSTFDLDDGSVVHGPAVAPQAAYELRERDGTTEAKRRST